MSEKTRQETLRRRPDRRDVERPLAEILGIEVHFQPDEQAPPVDLDLLGRHIRQELSADETVAVCRLIASFRPWYEACTMLMRSRLNP